MQWIAITSEVRNIACKCSSPVAHTKACPCTSLSPLKRCGCACKTARKMRRGCRSASPVGLLESWLECVAVTEKRDPAAASAGHYAGTPTEILLQYLKVRSCAAGVCRSCAGASEQAECSSRAGLSATEAATAQYRPFSTHEALFQADVRLLCIHKCIVPAARSFDALCL